MDRLAAAVRERAPGLQGWAALEGSRRALAEARAQLSRPPTVAGAPAERGSAVDAPAERGSAVDRRAERGRAVERLVERACALAAALGASWPRRVVNATGIPLHTNLGRAPLARGAARAAANAAASYTNLEYELESGGRGDRLAAVCSKLALLAGAPAALAVNNNAAALLLALDTLARGREVIVSRGELVEIGGSFRLHEIAQRAGIELVEVGTTNRTHARDYERAIGARTALLLKVHRSNFELRGYVAEASLGELASLARAHAIPLVEDLGSGTLVDLGARGLPAPSYAPARLALGADAVLFSADKLLGGPQAGLILGSRELVEAMRVNPLARALRLDKMCLAALDWTLDCYLDGRAERELPVLRQLLEPLPQLELRARSLAERLEKAAAGRARIRVAPDRGFAGGGSLPGFELAGWVVALEAPAGAERVAQRLRAAHVPVVARVRDDALIFDVRTLLEGDEEAIEQALGEALAEPGRAG